MKLKGVLLPLPNSRIIFFFKLASLLIDFFFFTFHQAGDKESSRRTTGNGSRRTLGATPGWPPPKQGTSSASEGSAGRSSGLWAGLTEAQVSRASHSLATDSR